MEININRELAALDERVQQAEARADERLSRLGPVKGKASTADGAISVEVAPGGLLTNITLAPIALSADAETLARQITVLAEKATARAGSNMHKTLTPVLGPSGEKHLASLGYVPIEDEGDDDPDRDFADPLRHKRRR